MVIENLSGNFHLRTEITKVNRGVPLALINPWYKDILAKYYHLREVEIDEVDLKRAPRPLNPRNRRIPKNQDEDHTQNGETWTTDSWTYALWMDLYVFWKQTRLNQGVPDPDIQIRLRRAL